MFALIPGKDTLMNWIDIIFGHGKDLDSLQMGSRAVLVFFITLVLIRIAGVRTFGKRSAFDNVIIIMLGSVLSRAVVGASPFIPTVVGCLAFVLVHWLLARLSFRYDWIGRLIKGEQDSLYAGGNENEANMKKANMSKKDLLEGVRLKINEDSFREVEEIFIERNGELSVIKRK
jgi:uncharacterized membrane protein YcaP (DUF421 family)